MSSDEETTDEPVEETPGQQYKRMMMIIRRSLDQLEAAGFDSVQIFATTYDKKSERSRGYKLGVGSWFARWGQVIEYVEQTTGCNAEEGAEWARDNATEVDEDEDD
jgi:hypothetical protein